MDGESLARSESGEPVGLRARCEQQNKTMDGESLARSESGEPVGLRARCEQQNKTMDGESLARSESGEPVGLRARCEQQIKSAGWLAPFPKENEPLYKPYYKITEKDYLDLLDWTGREIHPKKSGAIPYDIPHIFDRLKIDKDQWLETIKNYDKWFYRIVGKISHAWELLKDTVNHWFKGSKINRKLFGD